ncbi:hypothetical protein TNCV_3026501, partial [Trichonephila clavipes]
MTLTTRLQWATKTVSEGWV